MSDDLRTGPGAPQGCVLAMHARPTAPETCDRCGAQTYTLYREWGKHDLHDMFCIECAATIRENAA